jgi:hypothetical protein
MLEHVSPGALFFAINNNLIIWHSGEKGKANFEDRANVAQTAKEITERGVVLCPLCKGRLTVHNIYKRHYRDEEGTRHDGWVAQGRCGACKKYPSLTPDFLMSYKHYEAEVIERVLTESEGGGNVEGLGGCAADISTMRRWIEQFKERGAQAVGWLLSTLLTVYERHISSLELQSKEKLKQLARLAREYPIAEDGTVIGRANIILTAHNLGFL